MVAEPRRDAAGSCPDENRLVVYLETGEAPADADEIRAHLDVCAACQELVAVLVRDGAPAAAPDDRADDLAPGTCVGRFVLAERLGAGAMGVVYAAHDPQLDRRVAVKVLHRGALPTRVATARLLREAQAMARLSHPGVAMVHEVGMIGDEVFVAMELVDGDTLATWLDTTRPWREIVRVFVQAGRGLAAAHAAGVVHRDFKPTNVVVGGDGRVRVLDFGLARVGAEAPGELAPSDDVEASPVTTRSGVVLGTPAYMAPEQRRCETATDRSDQYSFCVALHEALHGVRPPQVARTLPGRVRRIIQRGLSEAPGARFESMTALVDALHATLRGSGRWIAFASAAAVVSTVGLTLAAAGPARGKPCAGAASRLAAVWDADSKRTVEAAFRATDVGFADHVWQTSQRGLDAYATEWIETRTAACEATRVVGDQTEAQMGLRMVCLDRRLQELDALVDRFRTADEQTVSRAVHAVQVLPAIAACSDLQALAQPVPPPADATASGTVDRIRRLLAEATALLELGKYADGAPLAIEAVAAAREVGYRPVEAEALWLLGNFQAQLGELAASEASLHEAVRAAESGRHDELAAKSWIGLTAVRGLALQHFDDGLELAKHAQAAIERMGGNVEREISLGLNRARIYYYLGRIPESLADARRALAAAERQFGPDHEVVARALEVIALAHDELQEEDVALELYARSRAILERTIGPHHPELGPSLINEGAAHLELGHHADTERLARQALALFEATVGPDHASTAIALRLLGTSLSRRRAFAEALPVLERTLAVHAATLDANHPDVGTALSELANCLLGLDRSKEAVPLAARAHAVYLASLGPADVATGQAHAMWGEALLAAGDLEAAIATFEAAVAALEPVDDATALASALAGLGRTELARRQPRRAIDPLTRALTATEAAVHPAPRLRAVIQFALANALWDARADRARAHELATLARDSYAAEADASEERAAVDRWLRKHRRR
jgi:tetratricopeptide (TPR) repeat protein